MSNKAVDIYSNKEKKVRKRRKDRHQHIRIPVNDEWYKIIRRLAKKEDKTVADLIEELIKECLEETYIYQVSILEKNYETCTDYSVQTWVPYSVHETVFELSLEYNATIRHTAFSLVVHSLAKRGLKPCKKESDTAGILL